MVVLTENEKNTSHLSLTINQLVFLNGCGIGALVRDAVVIWGVLTVFRSLARGDVI